MAIYFEKNRKEKQIFDKSMVGYQWLFTNPLGDVHIFSRQWGCGGWRVGTGCDLCIGKGIMHGKM